MSRYTILNALLAVFFLPFFSCEKTGKNVDVDEKGSWAKMAEIVDGLTEPIFPDKTFSIIDFGAKADGIFDNTKAINDAIHECHESGGGTVLVPDGQYLSGAIHLLSNVNLHLEKGAEILFSTDPKDYYPLVHSSFEGVELMNYSPLIYAYKQNNIAVTGEGILNGQASNMNWWTWKGSDKYGWKKGMPNQQDSLNLPRLMEMARIGTQVNERVFGDNHFLRPSFFEPFECEKVLIKGVKIINAPMWIIHPIKCVDVIVDGVIVESHGPNNDGCDPEYSKNVLIKNSTFNTGDDCIAIKSGRDHDGRRVGITSENIVIKDCKMIDGHGGVVMGSEISAGVRNVFVENCVMDSPNLERAIRIKTNTRRGGFVENVYVRDIVVGEVKEALLKINMFYGVYSNQTGAFMPTISNINLENITVKKSGHYGVLVKGYKESPIKKITLKNVIIEKADDAISMENVIDVKMIDTYINGSLISYSN